MGIFDWFKKRRGGGDSAEPKKPKKKRKGSGGVGETAASHPRIPGSARSVERDARLLPKPAPKNYWDRRPSVMDDAGARRLFSPGFRTRNVDIRTLIHDARQLKHLGLPVWTSEHELAAAIDVRVRKLWWLATHRFDDRVMHYVQFEVPKRRGGTRVIMAPKKELKHVQRWLKRRLVDQLPVSNHAHGFLPDRSVRTNAAPHVGRRVVLKFDLEDFFGTVTFARVRGLLLAYGYSFDVATSLGLLMTEAVRQPVDVAGDLHYVPVGHRHCPQGAPTSPGICNAVARKLDQRLGGLAESIGFSYTRYADDLTFSGDDESKIAFLLRMVAEIVRDEGFVVNQKKTRVMRSGRSQKVTGVTVNETLGLSRKERRLLRARLHRMGNQKAAGDIQPAELDEVRGQLAYLRMLNPAQAEALTPDWL